MTGFEQTFAKLEELGYHPHKATLLRGGGINLLILSYSLWNNLIFESLIYKLNYIFYYSETRSYYRVSTSFTATYFDNDTSNFQFYDYLPTY